MKNVRTELVALLVGVAAVTGLGLVTAAPAQAFSPITYTADCPGNAVFQQLVFVDYSGSIIATEAWQDHPNGDIIPLGTTTPSTGAITYWPIQDYDTVQYQMTGSGDLNWYYHVDCFY